MFSSATLIALLGYDMGSGLILEFVSQASLFSENGKENKWPFGSFQAFCIIKHAQLLFKINVFIPNRDFVLILVSVLLYSKKRKCSLRCVRLCEFDDDL